MIIFRRVVAVLLAFVFFALYIPILVVFRVNDTVGNPNYYVDQLRKDDIYNFAYRELLPAALDEAAPSAGSKDAFDISKYKANVTSVVQKALPPEYLQAQVETAIKTVLPYCLGDTDSFVLKIPLKDRVNTSVSAVKAELNKPGVFSSMYDQLVTQMLDQIFDNSNGIPSGLSRTDLESALRKAAPPEWLLIQINGALDQAAPYMTEEQDHFNVRINIADRIDSLQGAIVNILKQRTSYDTIVQALVDAIMKQNLLRNVNLPAGIIVSDQEVRQAVTASLPLDWYQLAVSNLVTQVFDYLKGTRDTLSLSISLTDRKPVITAAIVDAANRAMAKSGLPVIDLGPYIRPALNTALPDNLTLGQSDLGSVLGTLDMTKQLRDYVKNGITFTDTDLRKQLGDNASKLDLVRDNIASGITFTDADLRKWLSNQDSQSGENFDSVRENLGTARKWKMLLWLLPGLVLVAIGFLGGRHWASRLMWVASVLLVTAIITFIAFGPVFSSVAEPRIHDQLVQQFSGGSSALETLLNNKAVSVAENAIDSFMSGIQKQALTLLFTSLVVLCFGIVWYIQEKRHIKHLK